MVATQRPAIAGNRARMDTRSNDRLAVLIAREVASLSALDAVIAREQRPEYVVMFRSMRTAKQANVEQMATVIRMNGGVPSEALGMRGRVLKMQSALAEQIGGTLQALRMLRRTDVDLLQRYREANERASGLRARALRSALGRTLVSCHLSTAHIAQWTESAAEAAALPFHLRQYFAGPHIKACMRCHLDRPGSRPALERDDPHPYTYVCAGCHDDARQELPADLAMQIDRWPDRARDARLIQHALGRASILNAFHTVLHRLSGLAPELPARAATKALNLPSIAPPPSPAPTETGGVVTVYPPSQAEAEYIAALFDYRTVRSRW